jgi:hypothetical protein
MLDTVSCSTQFPVSYVARHSETDSAKHCTLPPLFNTSGVLKILNSAVLILTSAVQRNRKNNAHAREKNTRTTPQPDFPEHEAGGTPLLLHRCTLQLSMTGSALSPVLALYLQCLHRFRIRQPTRAKATWNWSGDMFCGWKRSFP